MKQPDSDVTPPSHLAMAWPVLIVLRDARRALVNSEIETAVADYLDLNEAQRTRLKTPKSTAQTLFSYRLAWSRTLLKNMGAITNPEPATWRITDLGARTTSAEIERFIRNMYRTLGERVDSRRTSQTGPGPD
jgi:restriction endonuclease Mrr